MLNSKVINLGFLLLVTHSIASAETGAEKMMKSHSVSSTRIEKILMCETSELPSTLVPLFYKINGYSPFSRRESYIGEYTFLPGTLRIYNQPVERVYISKFMGEHNKDYYQYVTVLPDNANAAIVAKYAGFAYDDWNGKFINKGNNKVQINFQNGQTVISCIQPVLSFKATARPSAEGSQIPSYPN